MNNHSDGSVKVALNWGGDFWIDWLVLKISFKIIKQIQDE